MELWLVEGGAPPRKIELDLELGGDQLRDVEGRAVTGTTHFGTFAEAMAAQADRRRQDEIRASPLPSEWSVVVLEPDGPLRNELATLLRRSGFRVAAVDSERAAVDYLGGANPPACLVVDRAGLSGPSFPHDGARKTFGQTWLVFVESVPDRSGGRSLRDSPEQLASAVHLACSRHEIASHSAHPAR